MKIETFHLRLITPCFCAGANQSIAEFRAPSIRGKLHWWFRIVGGTRREENEVFGSVADDEGRGSAIIVRVGMGDLVSKWEPIKFQSNSSAGYLLYFAKKSANGARWVPNGALPVDSNLQLKLLWRRKISLASQNRFKLALNAFLLLGSLGLRSTRGMGCFQCKEFPFSGEAFENIVRQIRMTSPSFLADFGAFAGSGKQIIDGLGGQLRGLRQGFSAGMPGRPNPSALGSSIKPRQTSAVYLRPVQESSDKFRIVVFEAPAEKVLGLESRMKSPRLKNGIPLPAESCPP